MSKKAAVITILVLFVLNLAVGYFLFFSARIKADEITTSAKEAVGNVSSQNANQFALNGTLPKTDVAGDDPLGMTRYKGAMRTAYTQADGTTQTTYQVLVPINVILSYYKTQLAQKGWIPSSFTADKIIFTKDGQQTTVTASTARGVTTFTIAVK